MGSPDTLPEFKLLIDSDLETTKVDNATEDMDVLSETGRNSLHHLPACDNTQQTQERASGNRLLDSNSTCSVTSADNSEDAQHNLRCSNYTGVTDETNTNLERNIYVTDETNTNLERNIFVTDETDTNLEKRTCATDEPGTSFERKTCVTDEIDTDLERKVLVTNQNTDSERKTYVTDEIATDFERKTFDRDKIDTDSERKTYKTEDIDTNSERKTYISDKIDTDLERKANKTDEIATNLESNSSSTEQNDIVSGRQTYLNSHNGAIQSENKLGVPVKSEDRDSYDGTEDFHATISENVTIDSLSKRNSDCVESNAVSDNGSITVASSHPVTATPLKGFTDKEALVAVFGTLLVIMCIEIYTSSNKPLEETDLLERTDDLGLNLLFQTEEVPGTSREAGRNTRIRSKAAKKRKKQQQKLLGRMPVGKRKNRFAEKFEDLKRPLYEDLLTDVDHSLTCPICLEMYYLPCLCQPCGHIFCDPCLRRLTYQGSEGVLCPLCRTVIQCCVPDKEFNDQLMVSHADIFSVRHSTEKKSKYRHFHLPFTPPTPLSQRLMRHLVTNRNNFPVNEGTLYNVSKLLIGLLTGTCISVLIMLLSHVRGIQSARDVNIMFLSFCTGAIVTILFYKVMRL